MRRVLQVIGWFNPERCSSCWGGEDGTPLKMLSRMLSTFLAAPPYALASFAAQWVGLVSPVSDEASSRSRLGFKEGQGEPGELALEQRTGACYLAWEQETEEGATPPWLVSSPE